MNTKNNEGPQPWIDPALEAMIVASVLGETSAFETAEIERVLSDNPELAIFKRRIEAVHALVGAAVRPEQPRIQLSPARRQQLLEKLGARPNGAKNVFILPRPIWWSSRNLIAVAASLIIGGIIVTFFGTMVVFQAGQEPASFEGEAQGRVDETRSVAVASVAPENHPSSGVGYAQAKVDEKETPSEELSFAVTAARVAGVPLSAPSASMSVPQMPVATMPSAMATAAASRIGNGDMPAVSPVDQVGSDSASVASNSESSVREAGGKLTMAQAASINVFTGAWGKGVDAKTGDGDRVEKAKDRKPADQDSRDGFAVGDADSSTGATTVSSGTLRAGSVQADGEPVAMGEAKNYFAAGRYDLAAKRYNQILSADPDNAVARQGLEEVNSARAKSQDSAFNEARENLLKQVNRSWEIPVRKFDQAPPQKAPRPERLPTFQNEIPAVRQPFSTFSLHVSDVSFQLAKDSLAKGKMPDPERIRAEEFYNAFDYNDPGPALGEEVACRIEQCAHPFLQQRDLVRVALKVAAAGRATGQPLRLTILLDTSGSMEREDRAASVRKALQTLASLLGPNDRVTLIGFARTPRLLAEQVPGDQANNLVEIAAHTPAEGGTNLELALGLASELAQKQMLPGAQNRIVLLTDGAANLGNASPERLARQIEMTRQRGISFDACGVGANGLNDEMLEALTRKGDGRYYFLNKPEDAAAGFARQLAGALRPAAENVKVQVVFNPARVRQYRLIGFEKHLLKKEDFRNDKVEAAELSAEEAGVAVYQVQTLPEGEGELGEVFVRFRDPATRAMVEHSWTMPYDAKAPAFDQATPSMQLAATAALVAEKLRGDARVDLNTLAPAITNLRGQYPHQARVGELIRMFERMRQAIPTDH